MPPKREVGVGYTAARKTQKRGQPQQQAFMLRPRAVSPHNYRMQNMNDRTTKSVTCFS